MTTAFCSFADRPENAPVVRFGGPWTIAVNIKPTFRINREAELYLALATAGLGPGTCVLTAYDKLVPEGLRPRAEWPHIGSCRVRFDW
jgi:hypothetical protein